MAAVTSRYGIGDQAAANADSLVRCVLASGAAYVDTAAAYGDSEGALGRARAEIDRAGIRVCTKIGAGRRTQLDTLCDEARASAARLGGAPVDTMLLHSAPLELLDREDLSTSMGRVRALQVARRTGASTYGSETARAAMTKPWCDSLQIEYSIFNQQVWRDIQSLRRPHHEIVVRSVLCKGLLTNRADDAGTLTAPIAAERRALTALAEQWGYSLPELAMRFALDTPGVDVVLVGVASEAEVQTAMTAASKPPLTPEQFARLEAFDRSDLDCVHPERWTAIASA